MHSLLRGVIVQLYRVVLVNSVPIGLCHLVIVKRLGKLTFNITKLKAEVR